jgi:hypothetical protein
MQCVHQGYCRQCLSVCVYRQLGYSCVCGHTVVLQTLPLAHFLLHHPSFSYTPASMHDHHNHHHPHHPLLSLTTHNHISLPLILHHYFILSSISRPTRCDCTTPTVNAVTTWQTQHPMRTPTSTSLIKQRWTRHFLAARGSAHTACSTLLRTTWEGCTLALSRRLGTAWLWALRPLPTTSQTNPTRDRSFRCVVQCCNGHNVSARVILSQSSSPPARPA